MSEVILISEAQKVRAHNTLFAASFKPLSVARRQWKQLDCEGEHTICVALLAATHWLIIPEDDTLEMFGGDYSAEGFEKFINIIKGMA
jgi:hypothetical protein